MNHIRNTVGARLQSPDYPCKVGEAVRYVQSTYFSGLYCYMTNLEQTEGWLIWVLDRIGLLNAPEPWRPE